jgi:hypothetical protein
MRQRLQLAEFALEALDLVRHVTQLFAQDLECDDGLAPQIARAENDGTATLADLALEYIALADLRSGNEFNPRIR